MLELGYILLTILMTGLVFFGGIYTINLSYLNKPKRRRYKLKLIVGLCLFLVYETLLGLSGFLEVLFPPPPRFVLFLILPCFLFTGIFLYINRKRDWVKNIPSHWLIYVQVFRVVVETLFVYSVVDGILPKEVTIEGYNFDMILGFSALIIGWLFVKGNFYRLAIVWNYCGIAVLGSVIFVFMTSLIKPEMYGSSTPLLTSTATEVPYLFVAGYLMPLAIFIHVLSILNLKLNSIG